MRFNSKENAWQPRIKCNDCASEYQTFKISLCLQLRINYPSWRRSADTIMLDNIMYKTDESEPVKNFLMHFGNQDHQRIIREKKLADHR